MFLLQWEPKTLRRKDEVSAKIAMSLVCKSCNFEQCVETKSFTIYTTNGAWPSLEVFKKDVVFQVEEGFKCSKCEKTKKVSAECLKKLLVELNDRITEKWRRKAMQHHMRPRRPIPYVRPE